MFEFIVIVLSTLGVFFIIALFLTLFDYKSDDSKQDDNTPYDHLLKHLEEENGRLLKEANTIEAIRRLEMLNESLRNEIRTNTLEYEEEPSQDVYGRYTECEFNETMEEEISTAKDYRVVFSDVKGESKDVYNAEEPYLRSCRMTDELIIRMLESQKKDAENHHSDEADSPITPQAGELDTSPIAAFTGMSAAEAGWDAAAVSRAYARLVDNLREDDSEDERMPEDGVERSLTEAVRESFENNDGIRVLWEDSHGRTRAHYGSVDEIETANGKVIYFSVWGLGVSPRDVLRITKGRDTDGETIYRKGNR